MSRRALTLALAALGTGLFIVIGVPLPFLFGPMAACLIAALAGVPLLGMGPFGIAMRTILGVAVGASITPEVAHQIPGMAVSVAIIPLYIVLIGAVGVPFFQRFFGFDPATAWYSAMPGGLQDMVIFGTEAGGDTRALSLIHATRVLMLVTLAPILLTGLFGESLAGSVGAPASDIPLSDLLFMVLAALIGWKGGERIGLFGASVLGPLIVTAALSLSGVIEHRPPREAIFVAQYFIGIAIGVGYVGVTLLELRRFILAGVLFVLILSALAALVAEIVVALGIAPAKDAFLAFAPGGQAEMALLAIVTGADLGYVVVHHVLRILVVITGAPVAARLFRVRHKGSDP